MKNERGQAGILVVVGIVVATLMILAATSFMQTPADKITLVYGGGPFDKKAYDQTFLPGSGFVQKGPFNKAYEYPVTVRSYIVSLNKGEGDVAGADSITAVTSDNVQVEWQVNTYFKLNTERKVLRAFQDNVGFKYGAWESEGWDRMLGDYFRPQIESALQGATRNYTVEELYSSNKVLGEIQKAVSSGLKENINSALGGEYFCGPAHKTESDVCDDFDFRIPKKPNIPENIVAAFETNKESAVKVQTKKNEVEQKKQEAESIRVLADATREAGSAYLANRQMDALMEAAKNGSLNLWIMPSDNQGNLMLPKPTNNSAK
jgi:regulator of protease activity HflC (stomatin/prohibitin superfamily)